MILLTAFSPLARMSGTPCLSVFWAGREIFI